VKPLLDVSALRVEFATPDGVVRAVDGVDFRVGRGETVGIVGESGSGKTALALAILRLHDHTRGATVAGRIEFEGRDLARLSENEMRAVRGARIAMVFQEPASALDPVFTVGEQIAETLLAHRSISRAEARARAIELLRRVGIADPERASLSYPHQFSGGMRQRALIASAIACEPALIVADEPTSALDVTLRARILELLQQLSRELGTSLILITHDLAVVAHHAQRIAVMYGGAIVEEGRAGDVLSAPRHPYTVLLLRSRPGHAARRERWAAIGGVESALERPSGCRFRLRCPIAQAKCAEIEPRLAPATAVTSVPPAPPGIVEPHRAACHFSEEASRL
jgi:oligopeptide/dipeptide ABC transporter ATP-binding protein